MPLAQGRYAPRFGLSRREVIASRLRWLRGNVLGSPAGARSWARRSLELAVPENAETPVM